MANFRNHLHFRGFEAWVEVEYRPLPQFRVESNETTGEISAWIPSESGKRFAICYRKTQRDRYAFKSTLLLDGHFVDSIIHRKHTSSGVAPVKRLSSIEVSPTETRDFLFNNAVVTDDETYLNHPSSACVGEIKLALVLVKETRLEHGRKSYFRELPEVLKIHERTKTEFVHQVRCSEANTREEWVWDKAGKCVEIHRAATFIFKYRSLDRLQGKGIAPQPSIPNDTRSASAGNFPPENRALSIEQEDESEVEVDELEGDVDDNDEIIARERELLAALEDIRRLKRAKI